MSNNKQSSVDWLINHWKKLQSEGEKMSWNQIIEITQLAKAMHKEEIKNAVGVGSQFDRDYLYGYHDKEEQY